MAGLKYWIWLTCLRGLSNLTCLALLEHFGTPENIFLADAPELRSVQGVDRKQAALLADHSLERADRILGDCHRLGVQILTIQDAAYPGRLRDIYNPPCVLYIKGHLPVIEEEAVICMVGTRNCTPYGTRYAEQIAHGLAKGGAIVASGLARGIDSAASRGALMGGGVTLGLLGNGIDVIYPKENRDLYEDVAASGALISEYPPGTSPMPGNFPQRNRIMSGICVGALIVEAPVRSGALITASLALEQGRDVFALPGPADAYASRGCNRLIQEGAALVMEPEDILEMYISRFPDKIYMGRRKAPETDEPSPATEEKYSMRRGETPLRNGELLRGEIPLRNREPLQPLRNGGTSMQGGEPSGQESSRGNPMADSGIRLSRSGEKLPPEDEENLSVPVLDVANSELPETQIKILRLMSLTKPVVTDDLISGSGLPTSDVLVALTMLEIAGLVCQYSGKRYTRLVRLVEPPAEASQDEPLPGT